MSRPLHVYEETLLLALQDKKGTFASGAWCTQAVAGALLAELALEERVRVRDAKSDLHVLSRQPLGDPLLDECLQLIGRERKSKSVQSWLSKIAGWKELKHRAAEGLCRRGVLRSDIDKVMLFFERRVYPEVDPRPERELVERLRKTIFGDARDVDPRTVVLLALAHHTNLLQIVFDRKELKARKKRIEAIIEVDATGQATKQVVESIQAAIIFTTVIVPAVIS